MAKKNNYNNTWELPEFINKSKKIKVATYGTQTLNLLICKVLLKHILNWIMGVVPVLIVHSDRALSMVKEFL
jgi:hypothetical protein